MNGPARTIRFSDGSAIDAKAVILATGVSYRQLDAPGCTEMTGAGVYYGAALTEAEGCKDQDVYVVGGANSAGQAAVYLARFARSVTMLVRAASLEASMSYYLIQQIAGIQNITVRTCTEVDGGRTATGTWSGSRCATSTPATTEIVDAGQLFIFIGAAPRHRLARRRGGPRRPRLRAGRPGPQTQDEHGLAAGPAAVPPGDQRPRGVRGR